MARIRVSTVIDAPPTIVWEEVRRIGRHVDWIAEAGEIRFVGDQRAGVGTTYDCVTRLGPLRMTDRLVVTAWRESREIGVSHRGSIRGSGSFTLSRVRRDRTRFTCTERLAYPWWLGGPVGGFFGGFVLRRIWRRNLRVLKALVEEGRDQRPLST